MRVDKQKLLEMEMPYALLALNSGAGELSLFAATEAHGPMYVMRSPEWTPVRLAEEAGGCMSIIGGDSPHSIYAILECYVGYDFHGGGLFEITTDPDSNSEGPARLFSLPFAHRLTRLYRGGKEYLLVASLARTKADPDDWSHPGAVYALPYRGNRPDPARAFPVLQGVYRNHGMLVAPFGTERYILIGTGNGLFAGRVSDRSESWEWTRWLDTETSEMQLADLDGDGAPELVTITPFHGNLLTVYRWIDSRWQPIAGAELSFGHALWCGQLLGEPAIVVSNRSGSKDLLLFRLRTSDTPFLERSVLDRGVGAANVEIVNRGGSTLLFSANQETDEVALYRLTP